MKKLLRLSMIMIAMISCTSVVVAKDTSDTTNTHGIKERHLIMERTKDSIFVDMQIDFSSLDIATTELAVFAPRIEGDSNAIFLQSIGVYGRNRYIYYQRNPELNPIPREFVALEYKEKDKPDSILRYHIEMPLEKWMEECSLYANYSIYGCCGESLYDNDKLLTTFPLEAYKPELISVVRYVCRFTLVKTGDPSQLATLITGWNAQHLDVAFISFSDWFSFTSATVITRSPESMMECVYTCNWSPLGKSAYSTRSPVNVIFSE